MLDAFASESECGGDDGVNGGKDVRDDVHLGDALDENVAAVGAPLAVG